MIAAFQSGLDIHLATASLMFNLPPEQISKDQRSAAKAVNFGILFGIGPAKLAEDLTNSTKAPVTVETAKGFLRMYGKSYPRLMAWLQSAGTTAREVMYTTTMFGHIRRFDPPVRPVAQDFAGDPEGYAEAFDKYKGRLSGIEREGKNTPIQGTAAVIAKTAIAELERILPQYDAGIVLFVHDEIGVITSEFYAEEVAQVLKATMEEAGRKYMKQVPCLAEVDYGVNWLCEGFAEAA
jgi:DNA polymerase-1